MKEAYYHISFLLTLTATDVGQLNMNITKCCLQSKTKKNTTKTTVLDEVTLAGSNYKVDKIQALVEQRTRRLIPY